MALWRCRREGDRKAAQEAGLEVVEEACQSTNSTARSERDAGMLLLTR